MVKVGNLCFKDIEGYCGYTNISEMQFDSMRMAGATSFEIFVGDKVYNWSPTTYGEYLDGVDSIMQWEKKNG